IASRNNDIEVKYSNENSVKPEKSCYSQEVLRKSAYGTSEVKTKEEIEATKGTINSLYVEIKVKEDIEIYEEPLAGERPHQYSKSDEAFSNKSALTKHQRKHNGKKPYKCRKCNKKLSL
ncbi:unnamed protein product, partial [Meganyctiphanes norvegica]